MSDLKMGCIFFSVRGMHLNMATVNTPSANLKTMLLPWLPVGWLANEQELSRILPLGKTYSNILLEMGYLHLQATKPDTVGVALNNSPLGLAAYIMEKFSSWTNMANRDVEDGNLTEKFTLDELLTNVMVYWTTNSITSSMRFYSENLQFKPEDLEMQRSIHKNSYLLTIFHFCKFQDSNYRCPNRDRRFPS